MFTFVPDFIKMRTNTLHRHHIHTCTASELNML